MHSIAIVTDSTSSLNPADAQADGIVVVPLQVVLGAEVFTEGVDISAERIATALRDFVPVSTSRPSPELFGHVYRDLARQGFEHIVSIHLSAKMSGTLEAAQLAAESAPIPVTCVDSTHVGIATGFAAGRAARARNAGADVDQIVAAAQSASGNATVLIYVDTLEYLRRGGRVGSAAALIGSALAVKPILTLSDGVVKPLERVRTQSKALAKVESIIADAARACDDGFDIGVQHLASADVAQALADRLAATLGIERVPVDEVGAVIGAHVGPGTISVTLCPR